MKKAISGGGVPPAIGPYSAAIRAGDQLFVSGQIPIDPTTGELVPGDVEAQTARVLENMRVILEAGGCTFANVVRTTVYLTDLAHFGTMNAVYGRYFPAPYPARVTVQVSALPRGAQVEIDAIAVVAA
jgi:2-iminobutanoate/2-iminopropanoate deaminase